MRFDTILGVARAEARSIRRLARQHGIDLTTIHGTGVKGRVTRRDVEAAAAGAPAPAVAAPTPSREPRRQKMSMLRKTIGELVSACQGG